MASKLSLAFLLLVFLSILLQPTVLTAVKETNHHGLNVGMISSALSNKGYIAMSLILRQTLSILTPFEVSNNSTITIFCPLDKAFLSSKYPQPPFTLLQYHVALSKLDRKALQSSLPFESKINTLLPNHPLVVTTLPHHSDGASINEVKVTEWDIYNDGRVIIHGVEDFFDPVFQSILYPWYDVRVTKNEDESESSPRKDSNKDKNLFIIYLVVAVVLFAGLCISSLPCFRGQNRPDCRYVYSRSDDGALV